MASKHYLTAFLVLFAGASVAQQETASQADKVSTQNSNDKSSIQSTTPVLNVNVATMGDLDRIQGQIIVAQAQVQLAQAKSTLEKTQGSTTTSVSQEQLVSAAPIVAGVFGTEEHPYAKFVLGDGSQVVGRRGDVLPGDFRIVHVGIDKVVIRNKKGKEIVARFAASLPSAAPSTEVSKGAAPSPYYVPPAGNTITSGNE